jgi:hypothetical protein
VSDALGGIIPPTSNSTNAKLAALESDAHAGSVLLVELDQKLVIVSLYPFPCNGYRITAAKIMRLLPQVLMAWIISETARTQNARGTALSWRLRRALVGSIML